MTTARDEPARATGITELLSLDDAIATLGRSMAEQTGRRADRARRWLCRLGGAGKAGRLPPLLHQYWDSDPPAQITALFEHNARRCRAMGVTQRLWTDASARALLADRRPDLVAVYDSAPHPAMKCDLFRLVAVQAEGGVYLDADMALGRTAAGLWTTSPEGLVFKWDLPERRNAPNWCFGFAPHHPCLALVIEATARAMADAVARDPARALEGILGVSGPGRFTRAVGTYLAAEGQSASVAVREVAEAYRRVCNGPDVLGAPLDYKATGRHWQVAAQG